MTPVRIQRSVRVGLLFFWFASCSCLAATRHYYIAAEDVTWNYAPSGHNLLNGNPDSAALVAKAGMG